MTYRALVKGNYSPAKFSITQRPLPLSNKKTDLKIYCSSTCKEPRDGNC
jgi:hypothetical protein